ncbi:hypothetical protein KKH3_29470 [Pectobacterium actinidiae]|nr:hypothetical protein KKH3_29470 [Pectobacterium actinidiae]
MRHEYVTKNPWEMAFFTRPDIEVYPIKSKQLVCSGNTQALG